MPETVSALTTAAKNALHQTSPFLWLFDIDLDGTNALQVNDGDAAITFNGKSYSAFPVQIDGVASDSEGNLPTPTCTVSNLSGEVAARLESGALLDRYVHVYCLSRADTAFAFDRGWYRILAATLDNAQAAFTLGVAGLFDVRAPSRLQFRTRCDYQYGDAECAYSTALPNLISGTYPSFDPTRCDFSRDGSNGCTVHGLNEAANGRPNLHPKRFGGLPGIPKGPAQL